jgi:uncharacterized membrane protein
MAASPQRLRRPYIDWLRGVAVLIMMLAHTMDSWTMPSDRNTAAYRVVVKIAGMGAPLFLFLAGASVALAAGSRARRSGDVAAGAAAVRRRGWEIFGLAFLFRFQSWALGLFRAPASSMLKVDVLNIMGPAIAAAAAMWSIRARPGARVLLFSAAALAVCLLTPPLRVAAWPSVLPDPIEWYLRPPAGRSWFTFFPWVGLLFAGAAVGVLVDGTRDANSERRVNVAFLLAGTGLVAAGMAGSRLPPLHPSSAFWTTSLSYFVVRIGLMIAGLGLAYAWLRRPSAHRWSPLIVFGNSSLFVYWVHVELAYGGFSRPLRQALPFRRALAAYVLFTILMLVLTIVKNGVVSRWRRPPSTERDRPSGPVAPAATLRQRQESRTP